MGTDRERTTAPPAAAAAGEKSVKALIRRFNFTVKKSLGQNFLTDGFCADKIVRACGAAKGDAVLEIGPGLGALTLPLLESAAFVYAVEADARLCEILSELCAGYSNLRIINADIRKIDINSIIKGRFRVAANLPYYLASGVIMSLLERGGQIVSITATAQKEAAGRFLAGPGEKSYGRLSVMARFFADCRLVANIPRNCFYPRPNVDSCAIRFDTAEKYPGVAPEGLFKIVKAGFSARRKTLVNCLTRGGFAKADVLAALRACGLNAAVRGEELDLAAYAALHAALCERPPA